MEAANIGGARSGRRARAPIPPAAGRRDGRPPNPAPLGLAGFAGDDVHAQPDQRRSWSAQHIALGGGLLPIRPWRSPTAASPSSSPGSGSSAPATRSARWRSARTARSGSRSTSSSQSAGKGVPTRRSSAASGCTCGRGGSSPPTCSSRRCGRRERSRWCSCCWRSRSSSRQSATPRWPERLRDQRHDQARRLPRPGHGDRGLVHGVRGGAGVDFRPGTASGLPAGPVGPGSPVVHAARAPARLPALPLRKARLTVGSNQSYRLRTPERNPEGGALTMADAATTPVVRRSRPSSRRCSRSRSSIRPRTSSSTRC